ncbi:MAG: hypothetical protein COV76_02775 [Candidatus Omnitrophica bacterium CG11_big_fil_rev_8_21_14_0_20_64_10]|nr:MAG: hypothetical protein COV76_02775 [Candidatus Omnitrophica bacterium CG11_big_fil_rev_8_21_14_0_20_64_10]
MHSRAVKGLLAAILLASAAGWAWAETLEMVTYYPSANEIASDGIFDRLHANRFTIGPTYHPSQLPDADVPMGAVLVEDRVGIGTTLPQERLHLTGNLRLPATTAAGGLPVGGAILAGPDTALHGFGAGNFFAGLRAGNVTLTGQSNTGVGFEVLNGLASSSYNTAAGYQALGNNQSGDRNVAAGYQALLANLISDNNTAVGFTALTGNTGSGNTAAGFEVMLLNQDGNSNTAFGMGALDSNTTGSGNTVFGKLAFEQSAARDSTTAIGKEALGRNDGAENTAVGYRAGFSAAGGGHLLLGALAGLYETGSNRLYIDNSGVASPLIYGDFSGGLAAVNGNLTLGEMTPPGTAPNGETTGNVSVNDAYLRSIGQWASQISSGGSGDYPMWGDYIGTGAAVRTFDLGFQPAQVTIMVMFFSSPPQMLGERFEKAGVGASFLNHADNDPGIVILPNGFQILKPAVGASTSNWFNYSGGWYHFIVHKGPIREY